MPKQPGYYWAKWRIAADGTRDGDAMTPSNDWEIVHVIESGGEGADRWLVDVHGVEMPQQCDCFVWGAKVADIDAAEGAA